jgi:hypothetical protein
MAEHGTSATHSNDFEAHKATYQGFLKGSVVLALLCFYILVALVAFRFINSYNVLIGFAGLIIGIIALLIDVRAGNKWYLSGGWLIVFGLVTAIFLA